MPLNLLMTIHDSMNFNDIPVYYPTSAEQQEQNEKWRKEITEREETRAKEERNRLTNKSISDILVFLTAGTTFYLGNLHNMDSQTNIIYTAVATGISKSTGGLYATGDFYQHDPNWKIQAGIFVSTVIAIGYKLYTK